MIVLSTNLPLFHLVAVNIVVVTNFFMTDLSVLLSGSSQDLRDLGKVIKSNSISTFPWLDLMFVYKRRSCVFSFKGFLLFFMIYNSSAFYMTFTLIATVIPSYWWLESNLNRMLRNITIITLIKRWTWLNDITTVLYSFTLHQNKVIKASIEYLTIKNSYWTYCQNFSARKAKDLLNKKRLQINLVGDSY